MAISNCLFSPTYENPSGFSIRFVFANLVAKPHACGRQAQLILYKHVGDH